MKLDCGLSKKSKQKLRIEKLSSWHRKFAWLPKRVGDNDCRWLEYYERKGVLEFPRHDFYCGGFWVWEYKFQEK